jgi:hypothetical protein
MTIVDPLGRILTEIRDFAAVSAITSRIRGEEMAQGDKPPLVIIRSFPTTRLANAQRVPLLRHGYVILCFGTSPKQATTLAFAVAEAVHNLDPRTNASGVAIYQSLHGTIGGMETDPDTQWPFRSVFPSAIASTMAVTP